MCREILLFQRVFLPCFSPVHPGLLPKACGASSPCEVPALCQALSSYILRLFLTQPLISGREAPALSSHDTCVDGRKFLFYSCPPGRTRADSSETRCFLRLFL